MSICFTARPPACAHRRRAARSEMAGDQPLGHAAMRLKDEARRSPTGLVSRFP
jgi:hypothetical protein